jgi:signal transduction histidine kinase
MRDASNLAVHELRAPLTVAGGYASLLLDGSFGAGPEAWSNAVGKIAAKLAAANTLVDDLLLLARVEAESAPPCEDDLDLVAIARDAAARAQSRASQIGGTLEFESEDVEVHALGDSGMVATVIDNLLNNALLYGGSMPRVTIHIGRSPGPAVSITDHGRGIGLEARQHIFERFFRVVDPSPEPGSGLGLYFCTNLARRQGGTVSLDWSEIGQGSTFSLRLPAARA